jgi:hypothetical protein
LCVNSKQLSLVLQKLDKVMAGTWCEVTRKDLSCKRVEDLGPLPKEIQVKHLLRVVQFEFRKAGVDTVLGSKVWNTARDRNSCSCQNHNPLGVLQQVYDVLQSVNVLQSLALAQNLPNSICCCNEEILLCKVVWNRKLVV